MSRHMLPGRVDGRSPSSTRRPIIYALWPADPDRLALPGVTLLVVAPLLVAPLLVTLVLVALLLAGPACVRDEPTPASPTDQIPPEVTFLSPLEGARIADTLKVAAQITDEGGVARVSLLLDGQPRLVRHTPPWSFAYPCSAEADSQSHELRLDAADQAGNLAASPVRHVVLCPNRAPQVWIEHPADHRWIERGTPQEASSWRAQAWDPDEGALPSETIRWRLDGADLPDAGCAITPPPMTLGEHHLEARAADGWGRLAKAAVTFTVFDAPAADSPEGAWEALLVAFRARDAARPGQLAAADLRFHPCKEGTESAGAPWPRELWLERLATFLEDSLMSSLSIEATSTAAEHLIVQEQAWAKLEVKSMRLRVSWRKSGARVEAETETAARLFLRWDPAAGLWQLAAWWDLHDSRWSAGRGPSVSGLLRTGAESSG